MCGRIRKAADKRGKRGSKRLCGPDYRGGGHEKLQTSAESAAQRGYVDQIIEAADTRKYVIGALEMLFTKREDRPAKKHGTV